MDAKTFHESFKVLAKRLFIGCCTNSKELKHIEPVGITWPLSTVRTDDGYDMGDEPCLCNLPEDTKDYAKIMTGMAARTNALCLLFYYRDGDSIKAHCETIYGACMWRIPIKKIGIVEMLGSVEEVPTKGLVLYKGESSVN